MRLLAQFVGMCLLIGFFKLPAVERREVVAELAESGMSGEAIADVLDVSNAHRISG